jgi:hypothetical protein
MSGQDQWPEVRVVHVFPSGVASLPLPDGSAANCRVTVGHLDCPDGGLLHELRSGGERVPWRSLAVREDALASVGARSDLDAGTRAALARHVASTDYFEGL